MLKITGYCIAFLALTLSLAQAQTKPPATPAEAIAAYFKGGNDQLLVMAKDFPEDKYQFRLKPEMRSFGDVIVHVASGNVYAAKAGRGEKVKWDELDPKNYKTKAEIVALLEKSIHDANATLKTSPEGPKKDLEPWMGVMEHSAEHYGLLVAYYRANGIVPPSSRPKK
jgi:DinB family protein